MDGRRGGGKRWRFCWRKDRVGAEAESGADFWPRMYELVASTTAKVSTTTTAYVWYGFYWESKAFR